MAARHSETPREVVTCRIAPDLIKRLDKMSLEENRSRSELIERAVSEMLDRAAKPKKK